MKELTNSEVLNLGAMVPGTGMIYFAHSLRKIEDYDIQVTVYENEEKIKAKCQAIYQSMVKVLGAGFDFKSPAALEILAKPSGLELATTPISEAQMRSYKPNRDALYCLRLIQKEG